MTIETKKITSTSCKYLYTMLKLDPDNTGVHCIDIAKELNCSKPSVHNLMTKLIANGYVDMPLYKEASLTEKGRTAAEKITVYYNKLTVILKDAIPVLEDNFDAVFALIETMPNEILEKL